MPDTIATAFDTTLFDDDARDLAAPDLSLILGPDDSAFHVAPCEPPKKGGRYTSGSVHVVVHRGHGLWTHVYRVLRERQPDRLLVHLDKVFEGERGEEARRWALANLVSDGQ